MRQLLGCLFQSEWSSTILLDGSLPPSCLSSIVPGKSGEQLRGTRNPSMLEMLKGSSETPPSISFFIFQRKYGKEETAVLWRTKP